MRRSPISVLAVAALLAVLAACTPTAVGSGPSSTTTTTDGVDPTTSTTTTVPATTTTAPIVPGSSTSLLLPQSTAFSYLGASCGGIQEQVFATGFEDVTGNALGAVYLQTRCGGSGRGGGYHVTTYSAWVSVTWSLGGTVVSSAVLASAPGGLDPALVVSDAAGDQLQNQLTAINVTPSACTVGNTTYCTYRATLTIAP